PRLDRGAPDIAALMQRIDQLESELAQRGRRLQQLMGERDELRSLLVRRDAELSRLNRQIGALEARAEHSPAPFAATRRLLERLQRAGRPGRSDGPPRPRSPEPEARAGERRLVPWSKERPPRDVLAVVLFGLSEAEIGRVLSMVERSCAEHEIAPL